MPRGVSAVFLALMLTPETGKKKCALINRMGDRASSIRYYFYRRGDRSSVYFQFSLVLPHAFPKLVTGLMAKDLHWDYTLR